MNIDDILNKVYPLPETSKSRILEAVAERQYGKGFHLFHANKVERDIYFIKEGLVRAYTYLLDNEITFWFGKEGDTVVSMNSYVNNQKGYENIELLEDSVFYKINTSELTDLCLTDIHIANWGRKFAEQELLKAEERFIARQVKMASERYSELIRNSPELVQRIQLSYIASYLGITQVSLSRIRAKFK